MDADRLARKLAPLKPDEVRHWRRAMESANPELKTLIERQITATAHRVLGDFEAKPLLSLPPKGKARGELGLGEVIYEKTKWPFGLTRDELVQNLLVVGRSGAGKTNAVFHLLHQLIEKRIPFLFLDWKRTARHLLPRITRPIQVYTPGRRIAPMAFNPFLPPPGLEAHVYVQHLVDTLASAFTLGDGAKSLLQRAVMECLEADASDLSPERILEELNSIEVDSRSRLWRVSARRALESLVFSELVPSSTGVPQRQLVARLLHGSTIIELNGLSQSSKAFLIPMLCLWLYYARLGAPEREKLKLVIVVEEAHHVLQREDRRAHESVMNMLLRQCREIGIGMVIVDQHPHLLSAAALGNTYASLCLNLKDPADISRAAALSLVESEDKRWFSELPVGQAIVKLQDRWRKPFVVQIPHVAVEKGTVTDDALRRFVAGEGADSGRKVGMNGGKEQIPRIPESDTQRAEGSIVQKLLQDVRDHPFDAITTRYKRLGLAPSTGTRLVHRLQRSGWVESGVVFKGKTRLRLLRLTTSGYATIDELNVRISRESLEHAYWKHQWAKKLRMQGYAVQTEAPRCNGRVDVLGVKGKERVAVEVETGKSDVVSNVRNCLRSGFSHVIVAVTNRRVSDDIDNKLCRADLRSHVSVIASPVSFAEHSPSPDA